MTDLPRGSAVERVIESSIFVFDKDAKTTGWRKRIGLDLVEPQGKGRKLVAILT